MSELQLNVNIVCYFQRIPGTGYVSIQLRPATSLISFNAVPRWADNQRVRDGIVTYRLPFGPRTKLAFFLHEHLNDFILPCE